MSSARQDIAHGIAAAVGIVVIALAASLVTGFGSRADIVPWLIATALGLVCWGLVLGARGWRARSLLGGLLLIEIGVLWTIVHFSGGGPFSTFVIRWFFFVNLFVALPWALGAGLGLGIRRRRVGRGRVG